MLLAESRKAAEQVIQEALRQLEEPTLISCAGSAGTLPGLQVFESCWHSIPCDTELRLLAWLHVRIAWACPGPGLSSVVGSWA